MLMSILQFRQAVDVPKKHQRAYARCRFETDDRLAPVHGIATIATYAILQRFHLWRIDVKIFVGLKIATSC